MLSRKTLHWFRGAASRSLCFCLFTVIALNALPAPLSRAAEITLTVDMLTDADGPAFRRCSSALGDCSLRGAISRANADTGNAYTIRVPGGVYELTLSGTEDGNAAGDLDIRVALAIIGDGPDRTLVDGGGIDRVLHIHGAAIAQISGLTVRGGKSAAGQEGRAGSPGGGVCNQGTLTLVDCVIRENVSGDGGQGDEYPYENGGAGGDGGGIHNAGTLVLTRCAISGNAAGNGGNGYSEPWIPYGTQAISSVRRLLNGKRRTFCSDRLSDEDGDGAHVSGLIGGAGGPGGSGGGIYNAGTLAMDHSLVEDNRPGIGGQGGVGQWYLGADGKRGSGGGLYNAHQADVSHTEVSNNLGYLEGGGIYTDRRLTLSYGRVVGNSARTGGGIYNASTLVVVHSTISDNYTTSGYPGASACCEGCGKMGPYPASSGGPGGPGGAIYSRGELRLVDSAVTGNHTGQGGPGGEGAECDVDGAAGGSGGEGGGLYNDGEATLIHCQISENRTGPGGAGGQGHADGAGGSGGRGGLGGGVYNSGTLTLTASTLGDNGTGMGGGSGSGTPAGDVGPGGSGAGISNRGTLAVSGSSLHGNQTGPGGGGGGLYLEGGDLVLTSTRILGNTARSGGGLAVEGGVLRLANDVLGRNRAHEAGSGMCIQDGTAHLVHVTLAQNTGGDGSGIDVSAATVVLTNTILVSHTLGIAVHDDGTAGLEATLWGAGAWANETDWAGSGTIVTGTTNLWGDPGFVNPRQGDYHIGEKSAAVDAGVDAGVRGDIDAQPRPHLIPDLGADEYWPPGTLRFIYLPLIMR